MRIRAPCEWGTPHAPDQAMQRREQPGIGQCKFPPGRGAAWPQNPLERAGLGYLSPSPSSRHGAKGPSF